MFINVLLNRSFARLGFTIAVLMFITLIGSGSIQSAHADSQNVIPSSTKPQQENALHESNGPTAANTRFYCTVFEVNASPAGVGIGCSPSNGPLTWFAVFPTDAKWANRVLSIGLTAKATGQKLFVDYDSDDVTDLPCNPAQCREILGIGLREG